MSLLPAEGSAKVAQKCEDSGTLHKVGCRHRLAIHVQQ